MGANNDQRRYATDNRQEIGKLWANDVHQSQYEDGHSYSGAIGMLGTQIEKWHDVSLPTEREAEDFILEKHQKWAPAIAASFLLPNGKKGWVVGGWCAS